MIDEIAIVSVAGVLLWSWASPDLGTRSSIHAAINQLFHDVLLRDGDAREPHYDTGSSRIKWNRCKERGVVVVATYNRELARSHDFSYVDKLLAATAQVVREHVAEAMGALTETLDFDRQWAAVQRTAALHTKGAAFAMPPTESSGPDATTDPADDYDDLIDDPDALGSMINALSETPTSEPSKSAGPTMSRDERMAAIKARRSAKGGSGMGRAGSSRFAGIKASGKGSGKTAAEASPTASKSPKGVKMGKKATAGGLRKLSRREMAALSYNDSEGLDAAASAAAAGEPVQFGEGELDIEVDWGDDSGSGTGTGGAASASDSSSSSSSWFAGTAFGRALGVFSGGHTLTEADLETVGAELEEHLKTKNVTAGIAADLVDGVKASLIGTKAGAFSSMMEVIRDALRTRITRILTHEKRVDPISDARANRDRFAASSASSTAAPFRPYIIVFTGVNGVGKSTSLAKLVYHLKSSGLRPMVAACDTFRSGAVEQLRRHTTALKVALFEKGYEKDPARVATAAVAAATEGEFDVLCIDTAGRMQGKKDLMQELAQLVSINDPDLVLFVGEALAGHDGLDQLTRFDKSLRAYAAPGTTPHGIDGIFLTKCDTIDDKIGAAVSMVHGTEIPIAFMGVGQKYTDMKRLNVDVVVRALMA